MVFSTRKALEKHEKAPKSTRAPGPESTRKAPESTRKAPKSTRKAPEKQQKKHHQKAAETLSTRLFLLESGFCPIGPSTECILLKAAVFHCTQENPKWKGANFQKTGPKNGQNDQNNMEFSTPKWNLRRF